MLPCSADRDIKEFRAIIIGVISLDKPADEVTPADSYRNIKDDRCLFVTLIAVDRPGLNGSAEPLVVNETPNELSLRCIRRANAKRSAICDVTRFVKLQRKISDDERMHKIVSREGSRLRLERPER